MAWSAAVGGAAEQAALAALDAKYAKEDEAWRAPLTASYRPGSAQQVAAADGRTPVDDAVDLGREYDVFQRFH